MDDGFVLNIVSTPAPSGGAASRGKKSHQTQKLQRKIEVKSATKQAQRQANREANRQQGNTRQPAAASATTSVSASARSVSSAPRQQVQKPVTASSDATQQPLAGGEVEIVKRQAAEVAPPLGAGGVVEAKAARTGTAKKPFLDPNDVSKSVLDSYMKEHYPEEHGKKRKADGVRTSSL